MDRWQRPAAEPIPRRRALSDWCRRVEPRRALRRALALVAAALLAQLGWHWRVEAAALGQRSDLVVIDRPVDAGQIISGEDVRIVSWPDRLAPVGALRALPVGSVARDDLVPGEILARHRLFPDRRGLEPDQRAVTIPQPAAISPAAVGDTVELFGLLPIGDGLSTNATRLAEGTVVEVTEATLSIAVATDLVPRIIEHVALGVVEVVLVP